MVKKVMETLERGVYMWLWIFELFVAFCGMEYLLEHLIKELKNND